MAEKVEIIFMGIANKLAEAYREMAAEDTKSVERGYLKMLSLADQLKRRLVDIEKRFKADKMNTENTTARSRFYGHLFSGCSISSKPLGGRERQRDEVGFYCQKYVDPIAKNQFFRVMDRRPIVCYSTEVVNSAVFPLIGDRLMKSCTAYLTCLFLLALSATAQAEIPVVDWTRQLGTPSYDLGKGVSVDGSGNAYVTGTTYGSLDGNNSAGKWDMFLTKYDSAGTKLWTQQLGTASDDEGYGVSVDGSGNAYVTGSTEGGLDGNTSAGGSDMFLTKYDTAGTKLWTRQLGTASDDFGEGVSVDGSGNAYVTGCTGSDMFLTKYDTDGTKLWTEQLGTPNYDGGFGVSVDASGNAYVTGYTHGGLDGNTSAGDDDMFLTKYDTVGTKLWTEQLGTPSYDIGEGVSVDGSGNAYVTGFTSRSLDGNTSAGSNDMFLTKYDTAGTKLWTEQLGTDGMDEGYGVSVDGSGNAYVTGRTKGSLDGNISAGSSDMFLTKYNMDGTRLWTEQLGTASDDEGYGVSVDGSGNAYVTGYTKGGLDGNTSAGYHDMFLTKIIVPVPGDANGDGNVDIIDLGILATNYVQGGGFGWEQGDFTGDGFVDVADLGILATNYRYGTTVASVPEPAIIAMLTGIALMALLRRKRKHI